MANTKKGEKGFQTVCFDDRFYSKFEKSNGCLNWEGAKTSRGYGQIWMDGKSVYAHRVSYENNVGPIPEGLEIDHLCENPSCVRPDHLEAVTHTENLLRAARRIDYANRKKTHCDHGHALAGENLRPDPQGRRQCRECARVRDRARRAKARGEA